MEMAGFCSALTVDKPVDLTDASTDAKKAVIHEEIN